MHKIKGKPLFRILIFTLCLVISISAPIMILTRGANARADRDMTVLSLWQIDGFEGGKGSRASYLQNAATEYAKQNDCYVVVTAVSADAARLNLNGGAKPDLISYGAGMFGLESYITGSTPFYTWCHGGYCFLTLDGNAKFDDISCENTVINGGTDNLSGAAALLCGVGSAVTDKPTGAYVKLINGKYKYLLGTQRDIYRLKTRGVAFSVKPITEFNDLYQNISVTATDYKKQILAQRFINYILGESKNLTKLGLMLDEINLYEDEMRALEGLEYDCKLISPINERMKNELTSAINNSDVKKLKKLLN